MQARLQTTTLPTEGINSSLDIPDGDNHHEPDHQSSDINPDKDAALDFKSTQHLVPLAEYDFGMSIFC